MKYGISRAPAAAGNFQVQDSSCTNKNKLIGWHSIQATGQVLNGTARPLTFTSLSIPNTIRKGEMRTTQNCIESGGRKLSCESENINWICFAIDEERHGSLFFLLCCNLPPIPSPPFFGLPHLMSPPRGKSWQDHLLEDLRSSHAPSRPHSCPPVTANHGWCLGRD